MKGDIETAHKADANLAIRYVPLAKLRAQRRNARTHSPQQIRKIADSIKHFGFVNPLIVDGEGVIIAGHGRAEAAKILGMKLIPVVELEHLSKSQLRAYVLADNKLAELAGWDRELLAIELQELSSLDIDLTIAGFEVGEIDVLIQELPASSSDGNDVPPPVGAGPAVCRLGDLWQLGRHRILCGDALLSQSYERLLAGLKARVVFSDPPYNVRIDGHVSGLGKVHHREFEMASGEMSETEFISFLRAVFQNLALHTAPGSIVYSCMDWRHAFDLLSAARTLFELKNMVVWAKDVAGMGSFYRSQHELIFVLKQGRGAHRNNVQLGKHGRHRSNVWNYPSPSALGRHCEEGQLGALHPTCKPVALVADALLDSSRRSDIVLDPFLGSGTTLVAAERIGRTCRAIELDRLYVDVCIRRWQRHCGAQGVHVSSGKTFEKLERQNKGAGTS
jgi:DNA modification methylase